VYRRGTSSFAKVRVATTMIVVAVVVAVVMDGGGREGGGFGGGERGGDGGDGGRGISRSPSRMWLFNATQDTREAVGEA
jgi:hypothetical protein